jgi:hypothetical protein
MERLGEHSVQLTHSVGKEGDCGEESMRYPRREPKREWDCTKQLEHNESLGQVVVWSQEPSRVCLYQTLMFV